MSCKVNKVNNKTQGYLKDNLVQPFPFTEEKTEAPKGNDFLKENGSQNPGLLTFGVGSCL